VLVAPIGFTHSYHFNKREPEFSLAIVPHSTAKDIYVSKKNGSQVSRITYKLIKIITTKNTVIHTPGLVLVSQYEMTMAAAVISVGRVIAYEYQ
jgi:hypothetical protein